MLVLIKISYKRASEINFRIFQESVSCRTEIDIVILLIFYFILISIDKRRSIILTLEYSFYTPHSLFVNIRMYIGKVTILDIFT